MYKAAAAKEQAAFDVEHAKDLEAYNKNMQEDSDAKYAAQVAEQLKTSENAPSKNVSRSPRWPRMRMPFVHRTQRPGGAPKALCQKDTDRAARVEEEPDQDAGAAVLGHEAREAIGLRSRGNAAGQEV